MTAYRARIVSSLEEGGGGRVMTIPGTAVHVSHALSVLLWFQEVS